MTHSVLPPVFNLTLVIVVTDQFLYKAHLTSQHNLQIPPDYW